MSTMPRASMGSATVLGGGWFQRCKIVGEYADADYFLEFFMPVYETLGLEMEMVVVNQNNGQSHCVPAEYFERLRAIRLARKEAACASVLGERLSGMSSPLGMSSIDNGYNLLETSFLPVRQTDGGLDTLAVRVHQELKDVQAALAGVQATLLNASEHPDCTVDLAWYRRACAPRPIYKEWGDHRRWRHFVGMDAKAQNGPCTSVDIHHAARALNVILALAPASIALFANSPLALGHPTGLKEHRLMIWEEMFRNARFKGDQQLCRLPERPFEDLGDYFRWMFDSRIVSQALPLQWGQPYKSATATVYLEENPSLTQFLRSSSWRGQRSDTGEPVELVPSCGHLVYSQFAQFLDARWRYTLVSLPSMEEVFAHWDQPGGIETLYERYGVQGYLEGRSPGAVLPDVQSSQEAGAEIAATAPLSASALQLGLLRNMTQAETLVHTWGWQKLRRLRAKAIKYALDDDEVYALACETLSVARAGLSKTEQHWLGYADYVLQTRCTGADRMLEIWRQNPTNPGMLYAQRRLFVV